MLPMRAYLFIGLNAVRALSIIALLLVFSSSILVMADDIKAVNKFMDAKHSSNSSDPMVDCDYIEGSTVPNQPAGVFWAVLNRLLIIFQVIILLLSECGWPYKFFDKYFPVLGSEFGLGALGIFQCLIGAAVLSHHVDDFALVSAFFLFSLGCLNILIGLIFREKAKDKRSITNWRAEKKKLQAILPTVDMGSKIPQGTILSRRPYSPEPPSYGSRFSGHTDRDEKSMAPSEKPSFGGYGWGTAAEKKIGFTISKPQEAHPPYTTGPHVQFNVTPSSRQSSVSEEDKPDFKSSGEAI